MNNDFAFAVKNAMCTEPNTVTSQHRVLVRLRVASQGSPREVSHDTRMCSPSESQV